MLMILPLTIGKNSSNEDFVVDIEQLPHLFVSYNDEAQIQRLFTSLCALPSGNRQSMVSFALASSKTYSIAPVIKQNMFFKYYYRAGDVWNSNEGSKEKFMSSLSREMRLRSFILRKQLKNNLRPEKQFPSMIILLHDVFDIILSRKKSVGLIFLKLLLTGKELGMHIVAASNSTYRNLLKQLSQINPLAMEKYRGRLGACDCRISTSLGAELVMTAEDFVFFKEANGAEYHRLYPATDTQVGEQLATGYAMQESNPGASRLSPASTLSLYQ